MVRAWGRVGLLVGSLSLGMALPSAAVNPVYPLVAVSVDGTELATRGLLMNGRTLLPVRELTQQLNGTVRWDPHSKTVWAAFPDQGRTIRMTINSPVASIYTYDPDQPHRTGPFVERIRLDQPPVLLGGRVVAPVAAAAEVAGAVAYWEPEQKMVVIES